MLPRRNAYSRHRLSPRMGCEGEWVDKNVDLKKLAHGVDQFFKDDGFHEIRVDEDLHGSWF